VMMTAVSFIIGVLAMIVGTRGGAHTRRNKRTNVFIRIQVGNVVGILLKTALFVLLQPCIL
ncbi:hypothetical protein, partial [Enterobacter hormaechei]